MPRNTHITERVRQLERAASMRPRRDAAEYYNILALSRHPRHASMRPRRDAAEYESIRVNCNTGHGASMRPRRDAAEYGTMDTSQTLRPICFNEAAA